MMQAMHLHGLRGKAIDRYRCTLYNIAGDLGRCLDELQPYVLKYWSSTRGARSRVISPVSSLQFVHRYVLRAGDRVD